MTEGFRLDPALAGWRQGGARRVWVAVPHLDRGGGPSLRQHGRQRQARALCRMVDAHR